MEIKVWHKVERDYICTKRACIKIPEITGGVAYLTGAITGDGSIAACKRKAGGYRLKFNETPTHYEEIYVYAGPDEVQRRFPESKVERHNLFVLKQDPTSGAWVRMGQQRSPSSTSISGRSGAPRPTDSSWN